MGRRPAFFYGWIIVGIALVTMLLTYGIRHSFSVFFPPILDEFGWSRGSTALMYSLNILVYGLIAPLAGSCGDRWNPKWIMPLGALLLALSAAACSRATELWHFYVLFGVLAPLGNAFVGWPLLALALANWFTRKRAMVMGIGIMGGGLSFALGMFTDQMISLVGWRWSFVVLGGMVAGIIIPIHILLFHSRPEHKGLLPYGAQEAPAKSAGGKVQAPVEANEASTGWTVSRALRSYRLWMLAVAMMLYWGIASYMVMGHQVQFAEDVGYSSAFAASVFGISGIFIAVGQVSGFLADRWGREWVFALATVSSMISLVFLILVHDNSQPWLLYVYAVLFGFGAGLMSPIMAAGTADIFYGKHFGAIYGFIMTGMGIGAAVGPWLGGFIYDVYGSYFSAFVLAIGAYVISCLCFWVAAPRKGSQLSAEPVASRA